jgi:hypothetical protein
LKKIKEYHLSLGYFNRAMKIFEDLHPKEHNDIQQIEKSISQVKEMMSTVHLPQISNSLIKTTIEEQVKCMPKMLQTSFHID